MARQPQGEPRQRPGGRPPLRAEPRRLRAAPPLQAARPVQVVAPRSPSPACWGFWGWGLLAWAMPARVAGSHGRNSIEVAVARRCAFRSFRWVWRSRLLSIAPVDHPCGIAPIHVASVSCPGWPLRPAARDMFPAPGLLSAAFAPGILLLLRQDSPQQIAQVRRRMVLEVTADRHHSHDVGDRGASPTDLQALASPCFSRCRPKPGVIRSLSCSFECARPHRHHPRSAAFAGKPALSETQSAPGVPRSSLLLVTGQGPGYRDLAREQIATCKRACLMRETFAQGRVG